MEIEAEIDRRLREIRVRARASEAADEIDRASAPPRPGGARATPGHAALSLARAYGLDYHLGTAVERILDGAAQGERGAASLWEACRLIERYIELVEQNAAGAEVHAIPQSRPVALAPPAQAPPQPQRATLAPVPEAPRQDATAAEPPPPQSVPRQLVMMALHFVVVATVTIAAIVLFALLVELR